MANYAYPGGSPGFWESGRQSYGSWADALSPLGLGLLGLKPDATYQEWINRSGNSSFDFSQTLQKLFSQVYSNYHARSAQNPNLVFSDYLRDVNPYSLYNSVPQSMRVGQPDRNFVQPTRWVGGF